jgi:hypothetical protein
LICLTRFIVVSSHAPANRYIGINGTRFASNLIKEQGLNSLRLNRADSTGHSLFSDANLAVITVDLAPISEKRGLLIYGAPTNPVKETHSA